jgi:hypothetical protein
MLASYVKRSYAAYHPLRAVFKTEPNTVEYQLTANLKISTSRFARRLLCCDYRQPRKTNESELLRHYEYCLSY